jgi:hypothetical protein
MTNEHQSGSEPQDGSIEPAVNAAELLGTQAPSTGPEIIHNSHTDIFINPDSRDSERAHRLAEVWAHGLPEGWHRIPGSRKNKDRRTYLAKYQLDVPKSQTDLDELRNQHPHLVKAAEAQASILSEVELAGDVRRVVESDAMQEAAAYFGFNGVEFVEPIIGVVDRTESDDFPDQVGVYRYVEDLKTFLEVFPDGDVSDFNALVHHLQAQLQAAGIVPADLSHTQVLIGSNRQACLLDAAQFYRRDKPAE